MAAKNKYICPRTHTEATEKGCVECVRKKLYGGDDCAVIRILKEREKAKDAPKEDLGPYAVSPLRRRIGCTGIAISLLVLFLLVCFDPMHGSQFWQGVGAIAFIMLPTSIYIANPLLAELLGALGSGITVANSKAKALSNLADLDKMLKKD